MSDPRESQMAKTRWECFCTVSISGHVVQHLAEASPPALGISARRQSVEFQKLIGSGINMVGSGLELKSRIFESLFKAI